MAPTLSGFEFDILSKLVNGEAVSVPPRLRLRLEMAGVIREGAQGITVTPEGRRVARQWLGPSTTEVSSSTKAKAERDRRGRKLPLRRKSIF